MRRRGEGVVRILNVLSWVVLILGVLTTGLFALNSVGRVCVSGPGARQVCQNVVHIGSSLLAFVIPLLYTMFAWAVVKALALILHNSIQIRARLEDSNVPR
ncbi:MAG TPA: hypothetical protein VEC15_07320 [Actinomycetota bacterium]|nr:hypothetical protein [Actinomycetota bacterium]